MPKYSIRLEMLKLYFEYDEKYQEMTSLMYDFQNLI